MLFSLTEIEKSAKDFISENKHKKVVAFYGEMGAGKTTFIKAVCRQMGVKDNTASPTFSLINEYRTSTGEKIYHFDFYRIKNEAEALDIGVEEYFYSGNYCFIEWPEKIESLLPENCLKVKISVKGEKRELVIFE